MQTPFAVLEAPEVVAGLTHPLRARILAGFREPHTAAGVARWLELPRQQVGHHVRALQEQGLLDTVAERRTGNFVAQVLQSSAAAYAVSPRVLGPAALDPSGLRDRFSSQYLAATAGRTLTELGALRDRADAQGKQLATLTVDTVVRFRDPESQAAFARELQDAVAALVARHHDADAPGGRPFRVLAHAYPRPTAAAADTAAAREVP
ncbi:MAG: helix-turn-helix domain-containing protein [Gemmatimonadota bacterium]